MTTIRPLKLRLLAGALTLLVLGGGAEALAQGAAPAASPGVLDQAPPMTQGSTRAPPSPQVVEARRAMRDACAGDVRSFCADARDGRGGAMRCLRAHAAQLSPGCAAAGQALRDARKAAG